MNTRNEVPLPSLPDPQVRETEKVKRGLPAGWWWEWPVNEFDDGTQVAARLRDRRGRDRCTVWANACGFTWHTWDTHGIGGENASDGTLDMALREVELAIGRQAWR